uniref:PX domain-containing protein n=1 Tax=Amorphochlora amoebiformis TaxID=1561963 RepID=A0A7S0CUY1_9EUKA|mmetsp:Transcript_14255/g.22614  ORF Transcript_14255/g.22614 Transcript_14255/m.22614 type:complete len:144 (+) Transcript_14255:23-454(+)
MASGQSTARTSRVRSQEDVLYDRRIEEVGREIKSVKVKRAQKARSRQQVVLYQIDVETREREWATFKRFNAFYGFYRKLSKDFKKCGLPKFPPRHSKVFTDHNDPVFIEQRRKKLDKFMKELFKIPGMSNQECVLDFLGIRDH